MTSAKADKASQKAHAIDETIQDVLRRQETKDRHFRRSAYILLVLIGIIASAGIIRQNQIAEENNRHLACIVSFFSQSDRQDKTISNVNDCTVVAND